MTAIVHSIYSQSVHAPALNAGLMDNDAERYCMLYKTILALKKWLNNFLEIHFLGIQGRGRGHKVKYLKIIF